MPDQPSPPSVLVASPGHLEQLSGAIRELHSRYDADRTEVDERGNLLVLDGSRLVATYAAGHWASARIDRMEPIDG